MPYIKQETREKIEGAISNLIGTLKQYNDAKGNLNYTITRLILSYLSNKGIKYDTLSDVNGVLTDVQNEFYRRVVVPYEDEKISENGDLMPLKFFPFKKQNNNSIYKVKNEKRKNQN